MHRIAAIVFFAALVIVPVAAQDQPKAAHDVLVEVPTVLAPESKAAARIVVYETRGVNKVKPIEGAAVELALIDKAQASTALYSGKTGAGGAADASFVVPKLADGDYTLQVRTKSENGEHAQPFAVKLQREFRILLVSDKPLYQPGQLMRLRALSMDAMTMRALGAQEITFEIEDGRGNKVFKRAGKTDEFGVSSVDFQLADEVLMGDYKVTATIGGQRAEKSVTVKKYVLPKFKVQVKTDKPFYRPQEKIKGTVQADYFFGKPVTGAVAVKASTFDVAFREFQAVSVKTDAKGAAEFEIQLPDTFVGQPLEKGNAFAQLEVTVTDAAEHAETVTKTASVCSQPLLLGAVPESGKIVPGLENVLYVLASAPDGSPVEADVALKTPKQELKGRTNAAGFVAIRVTPALDELAGANLHVTVSAKDKQGNEAQRAVALSSEHGKDQILLRPGAAIARVGEKLALDMFGTFDRTVVYLDVVKRGQTMLTTTCELERGRARYDLPLTPDLFGSLEIHAYAFMGDAQVVRDARVVFVQPAQDLRIDVSADHAQYAPGQDAAISFRVLDGEGKGVRSALGVIVVDESVYALQEMQPGLEKIYFMLQKELLTPRIDIKWGGSLTGVLDPAEKPEEEARRKETAIVLMAPVVLPERRAAVNTMSQRVAQLAEKLQQVYWALQNHIVAQKSEFWVETGGKRALKPTVLEEAAEKAKLPKETLVDPWGNRLTIGDLGSLNSAFTFDYWARLMSAQNIQAVFQALVQWSLKNDPTAPDALDRMVKAKALTDLQVKDYFGQPYTMERLAKEDAAFAKDNLVRIADNARRNAIFQRLVELAGRESIITAQAAYVPDVLARLAQDDFAPVLVRPDGGQYQIEALAKENPAFAASNVAKIASGGRRGAIYGALGSLAAKGGLDKVVTAEAGGWAYRRGALATLVSEKLLTDEQTKDVAGRPFDLEELAREDAQFAAKSLVGSLLRGAAGKIDNAVCSNIHNKGAQQLPADAIDRLVKAKALGEADVTDPWGTRYRFTAVREGLPSTFGCGLTSGKFTLVSAGPDRKFDTADDVNAGGMQHQGQYQPNYQGCAFYQQDPAIHWLSIGGLEDAEEDALELKVKEGLGGREKNGRMRGARRDPFAPPPRPAAAPGVVAEKALRKLAEEDKKADEPYGGEGGDDGAPARLREYFPETLLWKPSLITDADGRAQLAFPMADSITTWRLTASASTVDGRLGSTTAGILVFQDFFVDIDLPVSLTQNDVVSVPVAVYNYLKEKQTVTLTLAKDDWFELRDEAEKAVEMEAGQVRVVYYRIRAKGLGPTNKLEIQAKGSKAKDAIRRTIEIVPDGQMVEAVFNGQLSGEIRHTVSIPANAVEGASKILFKAYPGVFASVLDGLDGMLRMPGG